jgi:hypothetical protein
LTIAGYGERKMNLKKNYAIIGLVLCTVVLTGTLIGVAVLQNGLRSEPNNENTTDTTIVGTGTIRYLDFEGGFFGIVSDDDAHYLPARIPQEYQQDGLRISFTIEPVEDQMSFHMWGILVELHKIETIK